MIFFDNQLILRHFKAQMSIKKINSFSLYFIIVLWCKMMALLSEESHIRTENTYDLLSCDRDFLSACWWNLIFFTILALKSSNPLETRTNMSTTTTVFLHIMGTHKPYCTIINNLLKDLWQNRIKLFRYCWLEIFVNNIARPNSWQVLVL